MYVALWPDNVIFQLKVLVPEFEICHIKMFSILTAPNQKVLQSLKNFRMMIIQISMFIEFHIQRYKILRL